MPTVAKRIAELERQVAMLAARVPSDRAPAERGDPNVPSVPLKRAAHQLGISEEAALKRAQRAGRRGHPGIKQFGGRWYFSPAYISQSVPSADLFSRA